MIVIHTPTLMEVVQYWMMIPAAVTSLASNMAKEYLIHMRIRVSW